MFKAVIRVVDVVEFLITFFMQTSHASYYTINAITMYRLVSSPFLLLLAIMGHHVWFKWLIAFSFFTDAIDGPLPRRYHVTSVSVQT